MKLDCNELQLLLRLAKYLMFDPRDRRDSIFIYAVTNNLSVMETNDILWEYGEKILGQSINNK